MPWRARTNVHVHGALRAGRPQLKRDPLDGTHVIDLSPLEQDILGDMAWDSHGVGELVGFIRSANPFFDNFAIFRELRALLERWVGRGWLKMAQSSERCAGMETIDDLVPFLDRMGPNAMDVDSEVALPEIALTDQAFIDVEWLKGAV